MTPAAPSPCAPPLTLPAHPAGDRFGRDRGALRLPEFLRRPVGKGEQVAAVKRLMREGDLHTVCEEARCPNLQECFSHGTATFMIMGKDCTRACSFCAVGTAAPAPLDPAEPASVARAAARLALRHVVITSVNRDDLPDGGAEHMRRTVEEVHAALPEATIEVLAPDFLDNLDDTRRVASARGLAVYNHNVETVPRLYPRVRHRARYERSLGVLQTVAREFPHLKVKTGVMVGLGETRAELFALMEDLRAHGVHILTIGQYLRPSLKHMPVAEYVTEEGYDDYRARGLLVGFEHVYAGPFVRSSYNAAEALRHAQEAAPPAPLTDSPPPRP
ncbi:MAG: lipoyl synthase [Deltaproteobacteria bacterium]|nr:lipoyl synthase [Deltaproteobacteria bacterium]